MLDVINRYAHGFTPRVREALCYCKLKSGVTDLVGVAECERDLPRTSESSIDSIASRIALLMQEFVADYPFQPSEDTIYAERELEAFGVRWLLTILQQMGVMKQVGESWHHEDLKIALNIVPKYYRLFDALLMMFERRGLLSISNGTINTLKGIDGLALQVLSAEREKFRQEFVTQYPTFVAFLDLREISVYRSREPRKLR